MRSRTEMMSEFVRMLRRQLEQVPEDFFKDELSSENFLGPSLTALNEEAEAWIQEGSSAPEFEVFLKRVKGLRMLVTRRFGLELPDSDDVMGSFQVEEDAPVVVSVSEFRDPDSPDDHRDDQGVSEVTERMAWMLQPPGNPDGGTEGTS
mmetsp:Transcript_19025/g.29696  ORF Transcript_19025/g.29696 Transcript_19025/m.29696 type:complete len:149 (+) Transcript_19025:388-834(+)|eukprot:CAMPEP_0184315232 /NCGR_PEP_ID=MMETSP1049-20130417/80865_1 /TAXON_ID=77928 /ORGANISM="Proteomonas sulcata, Strain CCMP704" /LENGTH=148 /DNA_ID=CAMNT_0026633589 /DNA_START=340 /DNA_END=786 /DNA_ORIENTATION=+